MEGSNIVLKLKNNKIMIFVLFLLFVSIFSINTFAAENNSSKILEQKINIVVEDANLKEIINIIGDVTNLNITHNLKQNNEENENLMNLDFKNVPLEEVLNYITTINDLDYMVKNNIIYIAEESQLSKLYETRIISKVYEYENINKEEIEKVLRNADIVNLDEITITYVTDGMFLFKGEEKNLEKVNSFLINYVKFLNEEQKPDYDLKIIDTRYINDLEKLKLLLKELFHNEIQI
jgi:hypothetical protein